MPSPLLHSPWWYEIKHPVFNVHGVDSLNIVQSNEVKYRRWTPKIPRPPQTHKSQYDQPFRQKNHIYFSKSCLLSVNETIKMLYTYHLRCQVQGSRNSCQLLARSLLVFKAGSPFQYCLTISKIHLDSEISPQKSYPIRHMSAPQVCREKWAIIGKFTTWCVDRAFRNSYGYNMP